MASDVRQLYVMVNPTIPGLVKVGLTTVGVNDRARGLSSGLPTHFRVHGYVELPGISQSELHALERDVHKRLEQYRYSKDREFFTLSPDQALKVLQEVKRVALRYKSQGLTVTGDSQQPPLPDTPPIKTRNEQRREARLAAKLDQRARRHWHVWVEAERSDSRQVVALELDPRIYWSKTGVTRRVKREMSRQIHAEFILCRDTTCPNYGKRRTEI